MKDVFYNQEKNAILKKKRGVSFEDIKNAIDKGGLIDVINHPNKKQYPHQRILIVDMNNYIYAVPCVEDGERIFFKTIIPNRKYTKQYLKRKEKSI